MDEKIEKKEIIVYKILILGDSNVGKTSILLRFCDGKYDPESLTTVGLDYKKKFIKKKNKNIKLNICDTAGQERFRAIAKSVIKNADGIIIMYDISKKNTFHSIKDWINSIKENVDINKIGLVIAGNKMDLNNNREVDESMRKNLEEKQKIKVIETSAKDNTNVNELFIKLVDKMEELGLGLTHHSSLGENDDEPEKDGVQLKKNQLNKKNNNGNCCK